MEKRKKKSQKLEFFVKKEGISRKWVTALPWKHYDAFIAYKFNKVFCKKTVSSQSGSQSEVVSNNMTHSCCSEHLLSAKINVSYRALGFSEYRWEFHFQTRHLRLIIKSPTAKAFRLSRGFVKPFESPCKTIETRQHGNLGSRTPSRTIADLSNSIVLSAPREWRNNISLVRRLRPRKTTG